MRVFPDTHVIVSGLSFPGNERLVLKPATKGTQMTNPKTSPKSRRPREEAVRMGKEIYERAILPQVEANHFGEYVAIDVETGDWTIADTTRAAVERLRARRPDTVDVLCERVGYRALRSFGAGSLRRTG